MEKGVLGGLRVLDFTRVLAGPYATRILGDFGAEVIKVQSKKTAKGAELNGEPYFNTWNRNKRSITLDMAFPEAREIALKLTALSDVVVENFSPRVMWNWGLAFDRLKEVKPDLIMLSISGFGQTGPWKDYVSFGPTIQSLGGLTYLTSHTKDDPMGPGFSYGDVIAGLFGAFAALAALEFRDRTGQGQYIDLSAYEAMCTLMGPSLMDVWRNYRDILPSGNHAHHLQCAPYGCYRCNGEGGWCVIAVTDEREWESLCKVTGKPHLTRDKRFSSGSKRKAHTRELDGIIGRWAIVHTPEKAAELLQEAGVPAGVVQNAEELARDPQLLLRESFVSLDHPVLGNSVTDNSPIHSEGDLKCRWKAAPLLGEHNRYVFLELLGLDEDELSSFIERGVIG